ncbi:MAG: hypothetical protein WCW65_02645 [Candidatus Paceibacterota bacterium]
MSESLIENMPNDGSIPIKLNYELCAEDIVNLKELFDLVQYIPKDKEYFGFFTIGNILKKYEIELEAYYKRQNEESMIRYNNSNRS